MKTVKDVFATFKATLKNLYPAQETEAITLTVLTELLDTSKAMIPEVSGSVVIVLP